MNHVVIAGATGLIGNELLLQLTQQRCQAVTALVRRAIDLPHPHQSHVLIDFSAPLLPPPKSEQDTVICALGTTIKKAGSKAAFRSVDYAMVVDLAKVAKAEGYQTFAVVSSLGAQKPGSNFYLQTKFDMEQALQALDFKTLVIARPSLLLGDRAEFRAGEKVAEVVTSVLRPLFIGKLKHYQPVAAATVAKALIQTCAERPQGVIVLENERLLAFGEHRI